MNKILAPANSAAWLNAKCAKLDVKTAPYPTVRKDEIIVKNHAVAINPLDWIKQAAGDFIFAWIKYPFVLGSDLAGEVVEIGPGVTRFKVGDRVLGHAVGTDPKRNSAAEGAFQTYTVVLAKMASPIPGDMSYESAAVLPLGLSTAACGLFQKDQLALDHPTSQAKTNGKTLLVWGGSTSVGSNAIQLAVAAGYDVITTASPKNFEYVKSLGARYAFDYSSKTAVKDIVSALRGQRIAGALAVGAGSADACVDVVSACAGDKFVAMATFPISFERESQTFSKVVRFLWFTARMFFKSRTRRVKTKFIFGSSLINNEVGSLIYADFLPRALQEGRFVAAPQPNVVGHGLERVQAGLDMQRKGVSASKVVVTLPAR